MKNAASMRHVSVLFLLAVASPVPACGPPALPAGPKVKLPRGGGEGGKYQCRDVTGASEPWLVEWDPPAKARFQSASAGGVLLVKYQGCSLEVLYGCEVKGSYKFVETTRSLQTEHIGNEAELFAKLPIGALNLAGEFKKGDKWSLEYVVVGTRTASVKEVRRETLRGRCAGATHLVQGMAVGAYQLSAGASSKVGAEASLRGVGGAGGKVGSEARRLRQDGKYGECVKESTGAGDRGCQAIVKLYLQPVSGYAAVLAPPVPGSTPPRGEQTLPPVGAELGILRVEGTPRGARVDVSGPSKFAGPRAAALPRTWQNVPAGQYKVKVRAGNYEPYEATVRVLPDRTKVVTVALQKGYGDLTIGGSPAGAKVELSGPRGYNKVFGLTRGFTFRRIRRGVYSVKVTRTGYTSFTRRVRVQGGKSASVVVKLSQVTTTGGGTVAAGSGKAGITWVPSRPAGVTFSKTEVTLGQYRACVRAAACKKKTYKTKSDSSYCNWGHAGREQHPMNCVDWHGATAFCRWAGGRLPRSKEWFAEASKGGTRTYPWGSEKATCARAIMNDGGLGCGKKRTWPVCSKPRGNSVSGLCDMSGNVWEWTSTAKGSARVVRGGGWLADTQALLRSSARSDGPPSFRLRNDGFRCARSPH